MAYHNNYPAVCVCACVRAASSLSAVVLLKATKTGALPSLHPVTVTIQENV